MTDRHIFWRCFLLVPLALAVVYFMRIQHRGPFQSPRSIDIASRALIIEDREVDDGRVSTLHKEQKSYLHSMVEAGVCEHLYLDLGTNVGVSIRKVYEPQYYPRAPLIHKFDTSFGVNRTRVCSVGFEPNAVHVERLQTLQKSYRRAGFPTVIFTSTALAAQAGVLKFFRTPGQTEEGSSVIERLEGSEFDEAIAVDTDAFLNSLFQLWHSSASYSPASRVLAKMDIEGSEYFVLPRMFAGGSLCHISEMTVEWHPDILTKGAARHGPTYAADMLSEWKASGMCPSFSLIQLDDESYAVDPGPLPTHHSNFLQWLPADAF
ncbi:hypothetical protein B484DRAFT_447577 [Ochromonadaceae sp. CCMP2298]|nr:hypothetical protein B484DRAFT_447577 [Ochromonadaceae sp. CCMP2298]